MTHVLALDVGGTFIKSAIVDVTNGLPSWLDDVQRHDTPVGASNGTQLVDALIQISRAAMLRADISAVGVVTPGLLDEDNGIITYAANLKVRDLPLQRLLHDALKVPVAFGHDGRAAAIAEQNVGAATRFFDFALMPIGTGISVGLVIDGHIRNGGGYIGEIGHANVGHNINCSCGLVGCFEAIASTSAIARRYTEATAQHVDAKFVVTAALEGDVIAQQIWKDATDAIALSIDWLMNTVSPEAIVFAGGLSGAGPHLIDPVAEALAQRITFQRRPELLISALGDDAGAIGAAILAVVELEQ